MDSRNVCWLYFATSNDEHEWKEQRAGEALVLPLLFLLSDHAFDQNAVGHNVLFPM